MSGMLVTGKDHKIEIVNVNTDGKLVKVEKLFR